MHFEQKTKGVNQHAAWLFRVSSGGAWPLALTMHSNTGAGQHSHRTLHVWGGGLAYLRAVRKQALTGSAGQ
jgi:hypothetical protein